MYTHIEECIYMRKLMQWKGDCEEDVPVGRTTKEAEQMRVGEYMKKKELM